MQRPWSKLDFWQKLAMCKSFVTITSTTVFIVVGIDSHSVWRLSLGVIIFLAWGVLTFYEYRYYAVYQSMTDLKIKMEEDVEKIKASTEQLKKMNDDVSEMLRKQLNDFRNLP